MTLPYPVELNLAGREVVVVGGGAVAARKVSGLAGTGARVRVVSPSFTAALSQMTDIELLSRPYEASVLTGAFLVFACTDDPALNRRVAEDARAAGILCNVVDDPQVCDVLVPAVLRRGGLTLAVDTAGTCPALAATLRDRLENLVGPEYALLLEELRRARPEIRRQVPDGDLRRRIFRSLCTDASLELLATRGVDAWRAWMQGVVGRFLDGHPEPACNGG